MEQVSFRGHFYVAGLKLADEIAENILEKASEEMPTDEDVLKVRRELEQVSFRRHFHVVGLKRADEIAENIVEKASDELKVRRELEQVSSWRRQAMRCRQMRMF